MSIELDDGGDHDGSQGCLGEVGEQCREEEQGHDGETATTMPDIWVFAPAEPFTAVLERLPLTTIPTRCRIRGSLRPGRSTPVGIDLVMISGGICLGGTETLGEARPTSPRAPPGLCPGNGPVQSGAPSVGRPDSISPDDVTLRVRRGRTGPPRGCRRRRRSGGRVPGANPRSRRRRWRGTPGPPPVSEDGSRRGCSAMPQFLEEVAFARLRCQTAWAAAPR